MADFKTCKYCGKIKPATNQYWYLRKLKSGMVTICDAACRICKNKRRIELLSSDSSKKRLKKNLSPSRWNIELSKNKVRRDRFKSNNPGRTAELNAKYWKQQRWDLGDSYLKYLIVRDTSLSHSDIPAQLVEIKRKQLKLHRHVSKEQTTNH